MSRGAWCLAAALLLSGCATNKSSSTAPVIAVKDGVVNFRGNILRDSFDKLQAAVGAQPVRRLRMYSGGGEVIASTRIARWVYDNQIDVEVVGPCLSSCANYIFPAGKQKYITGRGLVAWHGTAGHRLYLHRKGIKRLGADEMAVFELAAKAEREFFAATGISSFMPWFAKLAPYHVYNFYILSQEDMAWFGMTGLHVRDDYTTQGFGPLNDKVRNNFVLVKIDRTVTNAADPNWTGVPPAP